jgi:hypothetical protein
MSHHHEDKKHKKLHQILKNRRYQQINQQEDTLAKGRDLEKEREEEIKEASRDSSRRVAKKNAGEQPVWSARMQEIRSRIDSKKRRADERWNRFAGTEDGGGRGL